ncbi:alpha/beta hydrolase [Pseudoruegeria sp. HB172150]|uniref:alpha/beta hydrolase n=1 Tax=Pseudoruegeria sp. HB172150 TaxID=2721164 RepID=UPI001556C812|nr:alpha/beta hydrolase [Pseudoruegeria sp. HB172150]
MTFHTLESSGAPGAPLLFTFHGTGGDETQFHGLARQMLPHAHIISPRGDVSEHGMKRYFRRTGEGVYDMEDLAKRTVTMAQFVADTKARTGASRVFGFGYSNGANILASVNFGYPDLFDRIGLLHPLIPWRPEPQPDLAGKKVLITAGRQDPICPAPATDALADWYSGQGAELSLVWHNGGHELVHDEIRALAAFLDPVAV